MRALHFIDAISDRVGKGIGWLLLVMTGLLVYAVILRYVFHNAPMWTHETSLFMYSAVGLLAGAYALLYKWHVRVDLVFERFSPRNQALLDVITTLLFFLPFCGLVGWFGLKFALRSMALGEISSSVWAPILWPVKMIIPIGALLLILQAVAKFIRDLYFVIYRRELS